MYEETDTVPATVLPETVKDLFAERPGQTAARAAEAQTDPLCEAAHFTHFIFYTLLNPVFTTNKMKTK
jgi:hypothetical protein